MGDLVRFEARDGVGLITVANPPVNALNLDVRRGLLAALDAALASDEVGAIAIRAEGRTFPAGAELRDYQQHVEVPTLAEVCAGIEQAHKPVIAGVHGTALGAGFELALACHYRLVDENAQLGFPDIALGVVPAAGGSQRLARIVGARPALDMLLSGRPISAETALRIGIADKVVHDNLPKALHASARNMARAGTPARPTCARTDGFGKPRAYLAAVAERRAAHAGDQMKATGCVIDLVEAALLLPFEAGVAMEHAYFEDLVDGDQARGLRHAFLAERRAVQAARETGHAAREIVRVAVMGAGPLAQGVVRSCLSAGLPVTVVDQDPSALAGLRGGVSDALARAVEAGRLDPKQREAQLAALALADTAGALSTADMVLVAVRSDPATRREAFELAGKATRVGTVIAHVDLGGDLPALAAASGRAQDVLGLRFFPPSYKTRLLEVVRQPLGAPDLAATGVALADRLAKVPILPEGGAGSLGVPVFGALMAAASDALIAGASPADVDAALRDYGFAFGPCELVDYVGLDRLADIDWPAPADLLLQRMAAAGLAGRRAGLGFYEYGEASDEPVPSKKCGQIASGLGEQLGVEPRRRGPEEIAERAALAMANAGANLVASGAAARPSDIDVAMLAGFGFPRWRGGPMEAADLMGLLEVRAKLRAFAQEGLAGLFLPSPLFDQLIKNGLGFERLNNGGLKVQRG